MGAIATQSFANVTYGPNGLSMLALGQSAQETLDALVADDTLREQRQAGIVDRHGGAATHTGRFDALYVISGAIQTWPLRRPRTVAGSTAGGSTFA